MESALAYLSIYDVRLCVRTHLHVVCVLCLLVLIRRQQSCVHAFIISGRTHVRVRMTAHIVRRTLYVEHSDELLVYKQYARTYVCTYVLTEVDNRGRAHTSKLKHSKFIGNHLPVEAMDGWVDAVVGDVRSL
jgi:hypothetical protein